MRTFRRICIFCGSHKGLDPYFAEVARAVGEHLARSNIGLVYGGGKVGLMGEIADAALRAGGQVFGVIPEKLRDVEVGHDGLTELFVVDSMHARKMMMAQLSDAFIALPGGFGTLEELFEATTWLQLGYHRKPVGLLNAGGYYDHLLAFLDHAAQQGLVLAEHRPLMLSAPDIVALLEMMAHVEIPHFYLGHAPPRL
ncbi:LOG family protein [Nannocystis radixulma]|uniref:Cytokinin riboside 5'-monophosphate phosphoribohydrolase n=1 Tax=Nannocystis radixulma TaxID=2995305 RepID=A0ABT5BPY9_9BACT|nr:TIGR00730 family Rossman fold protein [Nannocystis radixulma]MDC0675473.1 TIGR00730 family Rossman fold protein [Nannocystis radixulma]